MQHLEPTSKEVECTVGSLYNKRKLLTLKHKKSHKVIILYSEPA